MSINKYRIAVNQELEIRNGPGKKALLESFEYTYLPSSIAISFSVPGYVIKDVQIIGIKHATLINTDFLLEGKCNVDVKPSSGNFENFNFEASYDASNRTGKIIFSHT